MPEVEFCTTDVAEVDAEALERVKTAARESPKLRARLCLHRSSSDNLHEMLIVLRRGTEINVHRHPEKAECAHMVSGLMTVVLYDDAGNERQRVPLGPWGSGRSVLCRVAAGQWHRWEIESDEVVVHESTLGPFSPSDTEFFSAAGPR